MTQQIETSLMSETSTPIQSVGGKLRPRASRIAPTIGQQHSCANGQKTLGL